MSGILAHKLGPLAANRLRRLGEPVPELLLREERAASLSMLAGVPLIERLRASCDGPLVLIKGPEVARLYPGGARRFGDIDVLTDNAAAVQRALVTRGFVEIDDPDFHVPDHHHLPPLQWPTIGLQVEVHTSPNWPVHAQRPPIGEILDASVPSVLEIAGVSAPTPLHHALILASHAWRHEPLRTLRDLIDIAAVSAQADERELDRTAAAWGIGRLWRTTHRAIDAMFYGGRETFPLRSWARHLKPVRDRTGFEKHLGRLLHGYWGMPPLMAPVQTLRAFRYMIEPVPGESWGHKVTRVPQALRNLGAPVLRHDPHQGPKDDRPEPPDP